MTLDDHITWLKEERAYHRKEAAKEIAGPILGAGSWPLLGYAFGALYALARGSPCEAQACGEIASVLFGTFAIVGTLCGVADDEIAPDAAYHVEQVREFTAAIKESEKEVRT